MTFGCRITQETIVNRGFTGPSGVGSTGPTGSGVTGPTGGMGSTGPGFTGPTGGMGPTGPGDNSSFLAAYQSGTVDYAINETVQFDSSGAASGITLGSGLATFSQPGTYRVTADVTASSSDPPAQVFIQFLHNNSPVAGSVMASVVQDDPVSVSVSSLIQVGVGDTVGVQNIGGSITLNFANLTISRV